MVPVHQSPRMTTAKKLFQLQKLRNHTKHSLRRPSFFRGEHALQGTSEKIHFHRLVRQYSFQRKNLFTQDQFAGTPGNKIRMLRSVAPIVKQMASNTELPRKPPDVVACVHSFDCLVPEFLAVSLTLFSFHFAAPFPQSVQYKNVSFQGFTP